MFTFQLEKSEKDMDVDSPAITGQSHGSQKQSVLPEVEIFCYLLVTIFLIDQKKLKEVRTIWDLHSFIVCSLAVSFTSLQGWICAIARKRNA